MFLFLFLVIACLSSRFSWSQGSENTWSYEGDTGPNNWKKEFPTCGGFKQSPINILNDNTKSVSKVSDLPLGHFVNYEIYSNRSTLTNNGHSVQLEIKDLIAEFVNSERTKGYKFIQLHFHWGSKDDKGSEHSFDNTHLALEAHLVHANHKYKDSEGRLTPERLAVVAVLFEVSKNNNPDIEPIIEILDDVKTVGSSKELKRHFRLSNLLPKANFKYYTYYGSLTTPPCTENVVWIVSKTTNEIGEEQLKKFRSLQMSAFNLSINERGNARPIQDLKGRTVYYSNSIFIMPNIFLLLVLFIGRLFWISLF